MILANKFGFDKFKYIKYALINVKLYHLPRFK